MKQNNWYIPFFQHPPKGHAGGSPDAASRIFCGNSLGAASPGIRGKVFPETKKPVGNTHPQLFPAEFRKPLAAGRAELLPSPGAITGPSALLAALSQSATAWEMPTTSWWTRLGMRHSWLATIGTAAAVAFIRTSGKPGPATVGENSRCMTKERPRYSGHPEMCAWSRAPSRPEMNPPETFKKAGKGYLMPCRRASPVLPKA